MTDYFYDMDLVVDPLNPSNVVANGQVAIYDPADTAGTTLLALKDPSGLPLPNPLTSNANGFLPPRIAQIPQTMWKSGGFEGYFNSYKGLRDEAVAAKTAAQSAVNSAATAAADRVTTAAVQSGKLILTKADGTTIDTGSVLGPKGDKGDKGNDGANVLPTDAAIKNAITTPGTETATALSATYAGKAVEAQASAAAPRALAAGRKQRPSAPPQETVITRFQSGHGWTGANWGSLNPGDTSKSGLDVQAVSGTTPGTAVATVLNSPTLPAFNPVGQVFEIWFSVSAPANIASFNLYLGTDTTFANSNAVNILANTETGALIPNELTRMTVTLDGSSQLGTGVGTSCAAVRLRLQDKAGAPINVVYGGIAYYPKPSKGTVVFTFDDGWASQYTYGKAAMNRNRFTATAFPILEILNTPGHMTTAQLQELQNLHGWEIGGHCTTVARHNATLNVLTDAELETEFATQKAFLLDNQLHGDVHAYPKGTYNRAVLDKAGKYFQYARSTWGASKETSPPWDGLRAKAYGVTDNITLATLQGLIDNAITYGETIIFVIHDVANAGGTIFPATLNSLSDYAATKVAAGQLQVRTFGQAMAGL